MDEEEGDHRSMGISEAEAASELSGASGGSELSNFEGSGDPDESTEKKYEGAGLYYMNNFYLILDHVTWRDAHLFLEEEKNLFFVFRGLPLPCQRLLVRLYYRKVTFLSLLPPSSSLLPPPSSFLPPPLSLLSSHSPFSFLLHPFPFPLSPFPFLCSFLLPYLLSPLIFPGALV
jgi:hypothetical protein